MEKLTRFLWELEQETKGDYTGYDKIFKEFMRIEKDLIGKIKTDQEFPRADLKYRNKLNKLLANMSPYLIDVYNIHDAINKESIE